MKPINGRVIIKINKEQWTSLFVKKIKKDDGTYVDLFLNVEAGAEDDRRFSLNIQSGEVIAVCDSVKDVFPGDIALLDYVVSNDDANNLLEKTPDYELRCIRAITTIHEKDEIVYANRRSPRDQVIARKGDYDEISQLLGVIRNDELIARKPYVFLEHETNLISKVSASGILYEEEKQVYERLVLAASNESLIRPMIKKGDKVIVRDVDVFTVGAMGKKFDVVFEKDVMNIMNLKPGKEDLTTV